MEESPKFFHPTFKIYSKMVIPLHRHGYFLTQDLIHSFTAFSPHHTLCTSPGQPLYQVGHGYFLLKTIQNPTFNCLKIKIHTVSAGIQQHFTIWPSYPLVSSTTVSPVAISSKCCPLSIFLAFSSSSLCLKQPSAHSPQCTQHTTLHPFQSYRRITSSELPFENVPSRIIGTSLVCSCC